MLRRIVVAVLEAALAAVSIVLLVGVLTGSPRGTGEASAATTADPTTAPPPTSKCVLPSCTTVPPPPRTSPATIVAPTTTKPRTTPATAAAPRTLAPYTRRTFPNSQTSLAPTTSTVTTLPSIGGHLPVTPSTVPLTTKQQSSHVSPVFAALSGAGFFAALLIVAVRFLLTRRPKD